MYLNKINYLLSVTVVIFIILQLTTVVPTTGTRKRKRHNYDEKKMYKIESFSRSHGIYSDGLNYKYVQEYSTNDLIFLRCNMSRKKACPVRVIISESLENNIIEIHDKHNHEAPPDGNLYKIKTYKIEYNYKSRTIYWDDLNYKYVQDYSNNGLIFLLCKKYNSIPVCPVSAVICENSEEKIIEIFDEHNHKAPSDIMRTYKTETIVNYGKVITLYSDDLNYKYFKKYIQKSNMYLRCEKNNKHSEPCPVNAVISVNLKNNAIKIFREHNHDAPPEDVIRTYKKQTDLKSHNIYSDDLNYKYFEEIILDGNIYLRCNMCRKKPISCLVRAVVSDNLEDNSIKISLKHNHEAPEDRIGTYTVKTVVYDRDIYSDDLNYKYVVEKIRNGYIYLICIQYNKKDVSCLAKAILNDDLEDNKIIIPHKHNHDAPSDDDAIGMKIEEPKNQDIAPKEYCTTSDYQVEYHSCINSPNVNYITTVTGLNEDSYDASKNDRRNSPNFGITENTTGMNKDNVYISQEPDFNPDDITTEAGLNEGNPDVSKNDHLNSPNVVEITKNTTETKKGNSISEVNQLNSHKVNESDYGAGTVERSIYNEDDSLRYWDVPGDGHLPF